MLAMYTYTLPDTGHNISSCPHKLISYLFNLYTDPKITCTDNLSSQAKLACHKYTHIFMTCALSTLSSGSSVGMGTVQKHSDSGSAVATATLQSGEGSEGVGQH